MLFLQRVADESAPGVSVPVPISGAAALHLERALLAEDESARAAEVGRACAVDPDLTTWALALAEKRQFRTVNRPDEAARYLSEHLVAELAQAINSDTSVPSADSAEWRLLALVKRLWGYERGLSDFDRRLEHEKLESMKELAYGASHEINNPLANIAARAQSLLGEESDPERRQKLIAIHRQAMRAHEMISDLMLFARPPKLSRTLFDACQFVRKVLQSLEPLALEHAIHLELAGGEDIGEQLQICADETQLGVALQAVVRNAIEAADDDGHVRVMMQQTEDHGTLWQEILVRDDGPGISPEVRLHMFDPFYSGREAGRGLGFGLSKCWRIVTDHGGQILVDSPDSGGAEITIRVPVASEVGGTQT